MSLKVSCNGALAKRPTETVVGNRPVSKRTKPEPIFYNNTPDTCSAHQRQQRRQQQQTLFEQLINRPAPYFSVPAVAHSGLIYTANLAHFANHYLVIIFYPGDFSPTAATRIAHFSDSCAQFSAQTCTLVFCSTDSEFAHISWRQKIKRDCGGIGPIDAIMLSDRTRGMTRDYGVLCEETGQAAWALAVVDSKQVLRFVAADEDTNCCSADEVLRLVRALKQSDIDGRGSQV
ncbi:Peroxiredoxin-1 [Kickxella alabastrina]|uniref:Peroxiredoxin-1 n=1 Tax=Kickxella alabastrina TaxID=61397 RepID=A0ACC1IUE3_9FUNG|nr:Peroxiredoxin-1 [Kickxella alabastrina]